jgi:pimeloyl-ACP methyl ester carboxylesterase
MADGLVTAYDAALRAWPVPVDARDVPTRFGVTRVHIAGPESGRPIVLLHGGGMTSASWYATAGPLTEAGSRIYAVDIICDRGRSVPSETPVHTLADLTAWLRGVLDGLGVARADVAGHSYGGWLAAHFALTSPDTVDRLLLLDPSTVFTGFRPGYLAHSLPALLLGGGRRWQRFLDWETGGRADGPWARLMTERPLDGEDAQAVQRKLVLPKRPPAEQLRALDRPALVVVAGRSRAQDPAKLAIAARLLPNVTIEILPEATHHTIPAQDAGAVNAAISRFLESGQG